MFARQRCGVCWMYTLLPSLALLWEVFFSTPQGYELIFTAWHNCSSSEPHATEPAARDVLESLTTLHVVYSSDSSRFPGLLGSLLSLLRHSEASNSCSIHIIVGQNETAAARELLGCARGELGSLAASPRLEVQELKPLGLEFSSLKGQRAGGRPDLLSPLTYAWFNIQEYLPSAPRAIYLDTDTIIRADVQALYRMRLDHPVAAVPTLRNLFHYRFFPNVDHDLIVKAVQVGRRQVHNTGVMLLDLTPWRLGGNLTRSLEAWVLLFDGGGDADQLAFNLQFQGGVTPLDWRWNVFGLGCDIHPRHCLRAGGAPRRCVDAARILHFSGPIKPWGPNAEGLPHRALFDAHQVRTPCPVLEEDRRG